MILLQLNTDMRWRLDFKIVLKQEGGRLEMLLTVWWQVGETGSIGSRVIAEPAIPDAAISDLQDLAGRIPHVSQIQGEIQVLKSCPNGKSVI